MVKRRKSSQPRRSETTHLPLNTEEVSAEPTEEKVEEVKEEPMDTSESFEQIPEQIPEEVIREIPEETIETEEPKDDGSGTGLPIPQNTVRSEPIVKPSVTYVSPRPTVSRPVPKETPKPNMLKYGVMIGGAILGVLVLYFLFFSGGKKKTSGPTIVEVTEVKPIEEKKSEAEAANVNKMSSPRIIFGELRKNPTLAVAPTLK